MSKRDEGHWYRPGYDWHRDLPRLPRCMYCWNILWPWQPAEWVKDYGRRHRECSV